MIPTWLHIAEWSLIGMWILALIGEIALEMVGITLPKKEEVSECQ